MPSGRGEISVRAIWPRLLSSERGRSTLLCSSNVDMTWSPRRSTPFSARFSASVQLKAKATLSSSRACRKSESAERVSNTR